MAYFQAMSHLKELITKSPDPKSYARGYFAYLKTVIDQMDEGAIGQFIETLMAAQQAGKTIFFIGNGGSAATATHFSNDIQIGTRCQPPFKAVSLTDNTAILTAIGNDYGYEEIFSKQLEKLMQPGDVLVAISASGNSPNIVRAVKFAKSRGNRVVGLSGFEGGTLRELADIRIHVPSLKGEYGPVEDLHMIIDHLVGSYLMLKLSTEK